MNDILFEKEFQRSNITPRQFYNYCKKQMEKYGYAEWLPDSYNDWANPLMSCKFTVNHNDWEQPLMETCRQQPYNFQLFLSKSYNFIMSFDFVTESKGFGYFYLKEYKR